MPLRPTYILFADDDPEDQEMLTERFLKEIPDARFLCVRDGDQALKRLLECASDELPSMVILDYQMPGLTAPEVLEALGRDGRYEGIPIVVWSTSGEQCFVDRCLSRGAQHYLVKPCGSQGLEKITRFLVSVFSSVTTPHWAMSL
ncbi:MAG TPA: response regulator [Dinghuibacter sp.]|jgi:CheY-like chemotaxis protein|uniref:response regulator n=1 Tax=Dinghuibacter sp. TaxID=2024697 RepID=UPI002C52A529|nr:response regulator [Dinghuibacter sp.]HTJ14151.1 response regulator [Dinghuibacter sp.]